MSLVSGKKLFLLGFFIVLLIALPVAFYFVSQQQKIQVSTEKATVLSLSPTTQSTTVNSVVTFDVNVDPSGKNQVSFIKLLISYDATKLATTEASLTVVPWTAADGSPVTPVILSGPTYAEGAIEVTISAGQDNQQAIQNFTKIATLEFNAIAPTDAGTPSSVIFGNQTQVLSAGTAGEENNVLLSTSAGSVNIESAIPSETPTPTFIELIPTETPSASPTATITPTIAEELLSEAILTPTPTVIPEGLICSSLTADPGLTGEAPFSVNLTAIGNSSDYTISSVYFDFGDGQFKNVTETGGLGSNSISALTNHTYQTSGTFNASVTITDENGNTNTGNCTAVITVTGASGSASLTPVPSPLPPTGPTGMFIIGALGIIITIIGAVLLLTL